MKLLESGTLYADTLHGKFGFNPSASGFLGLLRCGVNFLGRIVPLDQRFGIYQTRPTPAGRVQVLMPFYRPTNPRTTTQQDNRAKMTAAVAEWQGLSDSTKELYNNRAAKLPMHGYNLFLREYLLNN